MLSQGREGSSQHRKQLFWRLSHAGHMGMPHRQPELNSREWFNPLPNSPSLPCSLELDNAQLYSLSLRSPSLNLQTGRLDIMFLISHAFSHVVLRR